MWKILLLHFFSIGTSISWGNFSKDFLFLGISLETVFIYIGFLKCSFWLNEKFKSQITGKLEWFTCSKNGILIKLQIFHFFFFCECNLEMRVLFIVILLRKYLVVITYELFWNYLYMKKIKQTFVFNLKYIYSAFE